MPPSERLVLLQAIAYKAFHVKFLSRTAGIVAVPATAVPELLTINLIPKLVLWNFERRYPASYSGVQNSVQQNGLDVPHLAALHSGCEHPSIEQLRLDQVM